MVGRLGRKLDHIAVGITEIDRVDETMIGYAAQLASLSLAFAIHGLQRRLVHLEGDMQIEIMLRLEVEGLIRGLEEGNEGAVVQTIKGVQDVGLAARL